MNTQTFESPWGSRSASYWITLILALGIIYIGARFIFQPEAGAHAYGIDFSNTHDIVYGKIKGIRDMFSGLALLPLLFLKMRRATAWVFTVAVAVPAFDFLMILFYNGSNDIAHLAIHGGTALAMVINSFLLFRSDYSRPLISSHE